MQNKNLEAYFLLRTQKNNSNAKHFSHRTRKVKLTPLTRIVRGGLWFALMALMLGGVGLVLPTTDAQVAGFATTRPDVRLAATTGVVVADITTESATSDPGFVITSQTPSMQCFMDSFYTALPTVNLEFQNAYPQYQRVQVAKDRADFIGNNDWIDLATLPGCGGGAVKILSRDLTTYFGSKLLGTSELTLYARFQTAAGVVTAPAVSDSILFGYPFISTQRGDVHTNGSVLGDASLTNSSRILCNPPVNSANADYIVSMTDGGNIQQVTNITGYPQCDNNGQSQQNDQRAETFATRGVSQEGNSLVVHLPEDISLDGKVDFSRLQAKATSVCPANLPLNFTATGSINVSGCTPGAGDGSDGQIIWLKLPQGISAGTVEIFNNAGVNGASVPIPNAASGASGAITIFASEDNVDFMIRSSIVYQDGTGAISNLAQLATFSVLNEDGDIAIHKDVHQLAGTFFAENGTISTSSQDSSKEKLSLYGSLVAASIDFNRYWLGLVQ